MNLTGIANRLTQRLANFKPESSPLELTELPVSTANSPNKKITSNQRTNVVEYLVPDSLANQDYLSKIMPALKKELNPNLEKALFLAGQFHQKHSTVQPAIVVQNLFLDNKPTNADSQTSHNFRSIHLFTPETDPSSTQSLPIQLLNQTISVYNQAQTEPLNRPTDLPPTIDFLK